MDAGAFRSLQTEQEHVLVKSSELAVTQLGSIPNMGTLGLFNNTKQLQVNLEYSSIGYVTADLCCL